jgi:hypothetical protein
MVLVGQGQHCMLLIYIVLTVVISLEIDTELQSSNCTSPGN